MLNSRLTIGCLLCCLALACKARDSPNRAPEVSDTAPQASSDQPASSVAGIASVVPPLRSARSTPFAGSGQAAELIELSGSELIERVRRSGKQAVIVNAWASWCGPCRREMPMLLALKENLGPRGIGVELVSVDSEESWPQAVEFLKQHGADLPSYIAQRPLGPFKLALNPQWPGMLPASFLFDSSGKLRFFWGGPVYENELLDVIDQFLAGTLVDGQANFGLAPGKTER